MASVKMCYCGRKYSIESLISWMWSSNNILLWWLDSTSNVYSAIGVWNLGLYQYELKLTEGKYFLLNKI